MTQAVSYKADDAELRGAWLACAAATPNATPGELARVARIPLAMALRVYTLRVGASLELIACWQARAIPTGRFERIVRRHAGDDRAQREAAIEWPDAARFFAKDA